MLAARQWVEPQTGRLRCCATVDRIVAQIDARPSSRPESYPDQGWTFACTMALAAVRISDALDGRDHSALRARWVAIARRHLVDARTGLLVAEFTYLGPHAGWAEGSRCGSPRTCSGWWT